MESKGAVELVGREGQDNSQLELSVDDDNVRSYKSTRSDIVDMQRLGKRQILVRHFRLLSTFSFVVILQGTWVWTLVGLNQGLIDGGLAGMAWSTFLIVVMFLPVIASIAEMASMAPTSGGQYHWISEFAPESMQKHLSFFAGWQATLAWQAGNAIGSIATGILIQTLVHMNMPTYIPSNWQGTLMAIANVLIILIVNVYGTKFFPLLQNLCLAFNFFLFLAVIIPLWVLSPHNTANEVFTVFETQSHYSSTAVSFFVCQLSAVLGSLGSDGGAHMAEEVRDSGLSVSRAIFWGYLFNGILGIILVWTICFSIPNIHAAVADPSGYPYLYALSFSMSNGWSTAISSGILILLFFSNVSTFASTVRETFAFARDEGFPYSAWLAKVDPKLKVPVNAMLCTAAISLALSLIYIGSPVAYYAIGSLNVVAIMATYTISICCVLWRRLTAPSTLPQARWSLSKYGIVLNSFSVVFTVWVFFWAFWPQYANVTPANFNWSSVLFAAVTLASLVTFWARGDKYIPPVRLVTRSLLRRSK